MNHTEKSTVPDPITEIEAACETTIESQRAMINRMGNMARKLQAYSDRLTGNRPSTEGDTLREDIPDALTGRLHHAMTSSMSELEILENAVARVLG